MKYLEKYLLVWLIATSGLAYAWPAWVDASVVGDPFTAGKSSLQAVIAVTMFCVGLLLPRDEVRQVLRRWPTVFGGTAVQYTAMPALAFAVGKLWGLTGDDFIGVVMVGCVPGAMASNVLTLHARGNTSYSVSLTTTATLLSPLAVPLVFALALSAEGVDRDVLWRASQTLVWTVVLPVLAGHLLSRRFPAWAPVTRRVGVIVANLAILWIISVVVGLHRQQLGQSRRDVLVALVVINLLGYLAGYLGGAALRLPDAMRRALTLEVGMQNAGLGASLAVTLFPNQAGVAIAPAMYTFGCMLTGAILASCWSRTPTQSDDAS